MRDEQRAVGRRRAVPRARAGARRLRRRSARARSRLARAIASASGLRQVFPVQTKRIFIRAHASPMRSGALSRRRRAGIAPGRMTRGRGPCSPRPSTAPTARAYRRRARAACRARSRRSTAQQSRRRHRRRYPGPVRARRRDRVAVRPDQPLRAGVRRPAHGDAALGPAQRAGTRRSPPGSTSVSGPGQCRAASCAA